MMAAGALQELKPLLNYDSTLPVMKAIGAPELIRYMVSEISLENAVILTKTATRHYIKHQFNW